MYVCVCIYFLFQIFFLSIFAEAIKREERVTFTFLLAICVYANSISTRRRDVFYTLHIAAHAIARSACNSPFVGNEPHVKVGTCFLRGIQRKVAKEKGEIAHDRRERTTTAREWHLSSSGKSTFLFLFFFFTAAQACTHVVLFFHRRIAAVKGSAHSTCMRPRGTRIIFQFIVGENSRNHASRTWCPPMHVYRCLTTSVYLYRENDLRNIRDDTAIIVRHARSMD